MLAVVSIVEVAGGESTAGCGEGAVLALRAGAAGRERLERARLFPRERISVHAEILSAPTILSRRESTEKHCNTQNLIYCHRGLETDRQGMNHCSDLLTDALEATRASCVRSTARAMYVCCIDSLRHRFCELTGPPPIPVRPWLASPLRRFEACFVVRVLALAFFIP